MSLRLVPPTTSTPQKLTVASHHTSTPSVPGALHDTLRRGLPATASQLNSSHPLEARQAGWTETQEALKMENLKRIFGVAEPVRRGMEKMIVGADFRPAVLGGPSNLHMDILNNRDCSIDWDDVFTGDDMAEIPDFHAEWEMRTMNGKSRP